jgi:hypothetical protein
LVVPIPKPPDPVAGIVRGLHEEVVQQLALTQHIAHPGENGRAREEIIRRFLRRFVPRGLGIDTGFVVDIHGDLSRQVDIVVYRNDYHPVLEIGGLKHFVVESVVAAIEIKASITSRAVLDDALRAVRSVKALDRTGGGANHIVMDFHGGGPAATPDNPHDRIWTAILTTNTLMSDTVLEVLAEDMRAHTLHLWLDTYVAVERFMTRYVDADTRLQFYADGADALVVTDPVADGGEPPLVDFALLLANRLRHAAVVDYVPGRYFPTSQHHAATLRFDDL